MAESESAGCQSALFKSIRSWLLGFMDTVSIFRYLPSVYSTIIEWLPMGKVLDTGAYEVFLSKNGEVVVPVIVLRNITAAIPISLTSGRNILTLPSESIISIVRACHFLFGFSIFCC